MTPPSFKKGFFVSPFRPASGLANAHLQTLFPSFHRRKPLSLKRERQKIYLADGDFLLLDYHTPKQCEPNAPLVLVIHGLSGSSESHYVLGLQRALAAIGWPSVAMNCRGATEPNQQTRAYHAGASDDVIAVYQHLLQHQARPIMIVGYSLGGAMTLKTLAELGTDERLWAGVAVSAPLELGICAQRLDRGLSKIYRRYLLTGLRQLWEAKHAHFVQQGAQAQAQQIAECLAKSPYQSFWQFDDQLMAPLHGFDNVHDYYSRCRPTQFLTHIRTPTLIIHAHDDPFMSSDVIPPSHTLSSCIHFELAQQGGHVGFITGSIQKPIYYLEQRIPAFLQMIQRQHAH
ncbi:hydrolase [Agitococcus lubricus]|uniref:AB hydrolase-1 domain-containing protein n=1 Tax=Agitococcus lubricus TaxID=1077255 RepID=A0A2T5IZD0_9GAMM|nr:hydrolase [Agitococcus lubricus]PTQ89408.1 hypothetical protein C8N29_107141 [Agitococcus lubricus]